MRMLHVRFCKITPHSVNDNTITAGLYPQSGVVLTAIKDRLIRNKLTLILIWPLLSPNK
jgi:hypothetical protein